MTNCFDFLLYPLHEFTKGRVPIPKRNGQLNTYDTNVPCNGNFIKGNYYQNGLKNKRTINIIIIIIVSIKYYCCHTQVVPALYKDQYSSPA